MYKPPSKESGRKKTSKLKWFGTLLTNGQDIEFLIAAKTRIKCLNAARKFNSKADPELIQPVTLSSRHYD